VRVPFEMVDVFAEAPFGGNQLCVVPEPPAGLDDVTMQALALEIGFSETTYVTATRTDGYDVRIFTPEEELPFAGHPTLGTAFVLARRGAVGTDVVQRCGAGDVPVRVDLEGLRATMRQLAPQFGEAFDDRDAVATAAGLGPDDLVDELPIVAVSTGIAHTMVPVRDDAALAGAVRNDRATAQVCERINAESLYLFTVRAAGDVRARMFDKGAQIGEDPATGSAAGPLGAYLSAHELAGMPGTVVVAQGEQVNRPSLLHVDVMSSGDSWEIDVGGGVRWIGDGAFEI
jgi:trans-2,3-dihydro-3-hydroxyanthranilate isomerase